jgi:phage recombination protein Bet
MNEAHLFWTQAGHAVVALVGRCNFDFCYFRRVSMETVDATQKKELPALAMSEDDLVNVLRNSLYPGAQTDSIKMVLGYCRAAGLDPIKKPVHIVPLWNSKVGAMVDVIMPGIGNYRTDAARSGQYAGVTKPVYGADVTGDIGGVKITYPVTCSVTVKRLLANGSIAEYEAEERWIENYAVKGGKDKSIAPNAMWMKRPYAQIAKCAEAQALRKAFPECGSAPTADEMEGKALDDSQSIESTATIVKETKPERKTYTLAELNAKYTIDKVDADGVVTKFSAKSLIELGEETSHNLIDFLSAKYLLPADVLDEINSWECDTK